MKRNEEPGQARPAPPPVKGRQDQRPDRERDPDAAERARPGNDVPDAARDVPPQEPPD